MTSARTWSALALALLLAMPSLLGCASPTTSSQPNSPAVDSTLLENNSPRAESYSKKVEDWLKRAADFLQSLPRKPLPCKPNSGSCA